MEIVKGLNALFKDAAPIAREILKSYANKDAQTDNSAWLAGELIHRVGGLDQKSAQTMSNDIINAIKNFSDSMNSMNQSPNLRADQWLNNRVDQSQQWSMQEKGQYFHRFNEALSVGNQTMYETLNNQSKPIELNEENLNALGKIALENVPAGYQYDTQDVSNLSKAIVDQARMMGANFYNVSPQILDDMLPPSDQPSVAESFLKAAIGSEIDQSVKMAAATALKTVVSKSPLLKKVLPSNVIADVACIGVEGIKSAVKVANGEMTAKEAVAHTAKSALAVAADVLIAKVPAAVVAPIPVIGPPLSLAIGTVFAPTVGSTVRKALNAINPFAKSESKTTIGRIRDSIIQTTIPTGGGILNKVKSLFSFA